MNKKGKSNKVIIKGLKGKAAATVSKIKLSISTSYNN
jgi:hypothetical protein